MNQNNFPEFANVNQICQLMPFLKPGGVRHLLFSNKLFRKSCAKKTGRKLLLHVPSVLDFFRNQPSE